MSENGRDVWKAKKPRENIFYRENRRLPCRRVFVAAHATKLPRNRENYVFKIPSVSNIQYPRERGGETFGRTNGSNK